MILSLNVSERAVKCILIFLIIKLILIYNNNVMYMYLLLTASVWSGSIAMFPVPFTTSYCNLKISFVLQDSLVTFTTSTSTSSSYFYYLYRITTYIQRGTPTAFM